MVVLFKFFHLFLVITFYSFPVAAGSIYVSQSQWTMEESSKLPDAYEGVELVVSRYPYELNNHRTLGMFDGVFSLYNKHHLLKRKHFKPAQG